jgi:hypothetical protein
MLIMGITLNTSIESNLNARCFIDPLKLDLM